ncbi:hypothetical protein B0T16DRAFT_449239 [Cercophora newfieldiana]|uniref:Glycoside hydrolase 131 catalytic N-terminal domain-containing protein n=1 Tax=Cercophora newfieldiana TaxID=92897 RepID=A0AA39XX58_9PEZI|nr:hypothetical protein B0T16DRAFT_449239 [Cercophora newfieldiana]
MPSTLLPFTLFAALVAGQVCDLQFDARVPADLGVAGFDDVNDVFSNANVLGAGLQFSQVIQLPNVGQALFDVDNTVAVEVTINDDSIFNGQTAFRRAELLPASNNGNDDSTVGIKSIHFSVMKSDARPLNLSHEYQLAFLETADFSANQFVLKTGTILGQNTADPDTLQIFGNTNSNLLLFSAPFTAGVFHNFALTLDFDALTTRVFYSQGNAALKSMGQVLVNDVSGRGQFHFGVLKKPVNPGADITKEGDQPAGIDEGIIFGSIFQEDTIVGCISLSA